MRWIGLTGGLGTGKSTVARLLSGCGIPVLDADRIAKQVVEPGGPAYQDVLQAFGPGLKLPDGSLDRAKLAAQVFGKPDQLEKLESLIHPHVQTEVLNQRKWLEQQGAPWAVYDVPLLFEKNLKPQFDFVIVVAASESQQICRVKQRNNWNDEEIQKRLNSQIPLSEKIKQADYVIQNDADLTSLEKKVATLVQMLNDRFQEDP